MCSVQLMADWDPRVAERFAWVLAVIGVGGTVLALVPEGSPRLGMLALVLVGGLAAPFTGSGSRWGRWTARAVSLASVATCGALIAAVQVSAIANDPIVRAPMSALPGDESCAQVMDRQGEGRVCLSARTSSSAPAFARGPQVAPAGMVELRAVWQNSADVVDHNVLLRVTLPEGFQYLGGSTRLMNANNREGIFLDDRVVGDTGTNIGHYTHNSNAIVLLVVLVDSGANWTCGTQVRTVTIDAVGDLGLTAHDEVPVEILRTC